MKQQKKKSRKLVLHMCAPHYTCTSQSCFLYITSSYLMVAIYKHNSPFRKTWVSWLLSQLLIVNG